MPEPPAREAQEPALGRAVQQHLRDRQTNQLGVGDRRAAPCTRSTRQDLIRQHESAVRRSSRSAITRPPPWSTLVLATPTFDGLSTSPRTEPRASAERNHSSSGDDDRLYGGDGNDFIQADSSASLSLLRESGSLCGRSIYTEALALQPGAPALDEGASGRKADRRCSCFRLAGALEAARQRVLQCATSGTKCGDPFGNVSVSTRRGSPMLARFLSSWRRGGGGSSGSRARDRRSALSTSGGGGGRAAAGACSLARRRPAGRCGPGW